MDPMVVKSNIQTLVKLYRRGTLPVADFSMAEMEGLLAANLDSDISQKELIAAFGVLGVRRKDHRVWSIDSLTTALSSRASEKPGQAQTAAPVG